MYLRQLPGKTYTAVVGCTRWLVVAVVTGKPARSSIQSQQPRLFNSKKTTSSGVECTRSIAPYDKPNVRNNAIRPEAVCRGRGHAWCGVQGMS